jgi:hypothetical protein
MCTAPLQLRCYLAEWYRPDVTAQPVDDIAAQLDAGVASLCAEGTPVQLRVTMVVPTDEVLYGLFLAHSPEVVVQACQRAGIPADRLSADVDALMTYSSVSAPIPQSACDAGS